MSPLTYRSFLFALFMVMTGVLLTGCGASKEENRRNEMISAEIRGEIAHRPEILEVDVYYLHTPTNIGNAIANILVKPESYVDEVADLALRLIWLSKLEPLASIDVGVSDRRGGPGVGRHFLLPEQQSELVAKFGPRPKLDGDDDERHAWLFVVVILVILVALVVAGGVLVRRRGRPLPQPSVRLDPGVARYFSDPGGEPRDPWAPPPGS